MGLGTLDQGASLVGVKMAKLHQMVRRDPTDGPASVIDRALQR